MTLTTGPNADRLGDSDSGPSGDITGSPERSEGIGLCPRKRLSGDTIRFASSASRRIPATSRHCLNRCDRRKRAPGRLRAARASGRPASPAGFTLLELVLVMVIICTVLAMAGPSLRGFFASRKTVDAAGGITALTRLARSRAIAEGRIYRLNLDTEAGTYWLTRQEEGGFKKLSTEFGRVFLLPQGTQASWEEPSEDVSRRHIAFYPTGRTDAATVRLTDRQGNTVRVSCPSPTERFSVVASVERRN